MNILPKKRWHVRTKDNIARVRRDEAEAQEKEKQRLEKLKFAESEARINFLRREKGLPERQQEETNADIPTTETKSQHVDLFADFKTHIKTTNKDLEKEQKEEREKYEKQIGYLTYLGQDTNEALKLRSWYEVAPKRTQTAYAAETEKEEKDMKNKYTQDPLTLINALLPTEKHVKLTKGTPKRCTSLVPVEKIEPTEETKEISKFRERKLKKHKKEKKSKKEKSKKEKHKKRDKERSITASNHKSKKSIHKDLEAVEKKRQENRHDLIDRLRKERLKREAAERERQDALLKPAETAAVVEEKKPQSMPRIKQKYNSQFNPELAKQNML